MKHQLKNLPPFQPGVVISIPLELLPAYFQREHLEPLSAKEVADKRGQGLRKPDGVLWVKRTTSEGHNANHSG